MITLVRKRVESKTLKFRVLDTEGSKCSPKNHTPSIPNDGQAGGNPSRPAQVSNLKSSTLNRGPSFSSGTASAVVEHGSAGSDGSGKGYGAHRVPPS